MSAADEIMASFGKIGVGRLDTEMPPKALAVAADFLTEHSPGAAPGTVAIVLRGALQGRGAPGDPKYRDLYERIVAA